MATLSVIFAVVSVITALLLTIVILMQNPKGQGGIGSIGGGVSEAMFGASAPSALVKITVTLAIIFLLSTLFHAAIVGHQRDQKSVGESIGDDFATQGAAEATPAIETVENAGETMTDADDETVENASEAGETTEGETAE
ncbi:MAG: preprotein translocase subunit SecG [Victivallales bacterium]|nr:preprotein translocase subunit SecG [Victivallales bacterium]